MVNKASGADYRDLRSEIEAELEQHEADVVLEELETLEAETGLDEVYLDELEIDGIAADLVDDDLDGGDLSSDEDSTEDEDESISDLPQAMTESYGTGLQGAPTDRAGRRSRSQLNQADAALTGGDIDANYEEANAVGDESVGGTVMTPDQDVVDELGAAVGLELEDGVFLRTNDILEERDDRRWELDPKSSEDYSDRREV